MQLQFTPYGYCQCGCGKRTAISAYTHRPRGWVKGEPRAYVKGHNGTGIARGPDYAVRDTGYGTPCWVWLKTVNDQGYGVTFRDRDYRAAHVAYYERVVGAVPDGLELDHLCRVRPCVNPTHLEPVTHKENMVRAIVATHVPGISALRDARVAARMSQDDVAAIVGVRQSLVSDWERGRRAYPSDVLARLRSLGRWD